jgi:hypothetical protein
MTKAEPGVVVHGNGQLHLRLHPARDGLGIDRPGRAVVRKEKDPESE